MSANSFTIHNDMSDLCRVCLQLPEKSQYLDLTTIYDEEENLTYGECFTICTQIDLSAGAGLPHHLCKQCGLELQMSYDFHKKIEDSKRFIEQFQMQKVKKGQITEPPATCRKAKSLNINKEVKGTKTNLIEEKYVISEGQLTAQLEGTEDDCLMEMENEQKYINEETNEIEILNNISKADSRDEHQVITHETNSILVETINENDEDHLDLDDYQNVEALEEEETETLQIKCGECVTPVHITNFKSVESGEIAEYVEYEEVFDEEKENDMLKEGEDEVYLHEIEEEEIEDSLAWQENVVAVANKEHLPIELENDEDEEYGEEGNCKNIESRLTANESSQDESNTNSSEHNNKISTSRKRHVGSYSCDYCHRVYPNYSRMKTHRRCHETDRPKFSCTHCGRMYATKQARDCHIQTAHDKSGYTCSICGKVFAIRKSLEIHVRYHTGDFPYECELCDRKFAQACHLNTHINVKHNKIRFSCEYPNCGKYFTSSSSLRNHEYTHGIMPFECEQCKQGYPAKSKLRIHIQRKHGMDMSNEQLEKMRKFHVMRSKVNLVQFVDT